MIFSSSQFLKCANIMTITAIFSGKYEDISFIVTNYIAASTKTIDKRKEFTTKQKILSKNSVVKVFSYITSILSFLEKSSIGGVTPEGVKSNSFAKPTSLNVASL